MAETETVTAAVIVIGNEILSGRTEEKNLAYIAKKLGAVGIRLMEARVVPDIEDRIVAAVNECRQAYDYVFTTGGIGPTHDDITAAAVAKAFGVHVIRHAEAEASLRRHYSDAHLNEARLKMADMPEGAGLIYNAVSAAPGFYMENVYVLAGVPAVMRAMVDEIVPKLRAGRPMISRTVTTFLGEGTVAEGLAALQRDYPKLDIGSYPFFRNGRFGTSLVVRGTDENEVAEAAHAISGLIRDLGGEPIEGEAV
jgi:molybdenum cofactor synthesis domain-containing protein